MPMIVFLFCAHVVIFFESIDHGFFSSITLLISSHAQDCFPLFLLTLQILLIIYTKIILSFSPYFAVAFLDSNNLSFFSTLFHSCEQSFYPSFLLICSFFYHSQPSFFLSFHSLCWFGLFFAHLPSFFFLLHPQWLNFLLHSFSPDHDECGTNVHDCDEQYGICHNTHGSYFCTCLDGFLLQDDNRTCLGKYLSASNQLKGSSRSLRSCFLSRVCHPLSFF